MFVQFNKRKLKWVCGSVIMCAALCLSVALISKSLDEKGNAIETISTNWGLSFKEKGKIPEGNASIENLEKYNAYFCDNSEKKRIYLTFDAGYENGYMEDILNVLKKEKVPGAFFVVGTYLRDNPLLIKRMVNEGHIVGNHTMTHPDMSAIADIEDFKKELKCVEELYKETVGESMKKYYRPPQGKYSEENLADAKKLGYKTVFWSLAYVDWFVDKQPSDEEAFSKLLPRIHNGAVVLLHSTSKTNARILEKLITNWKEEGYQFCSLDMLGKM